MSTDADLPPVPPLPGDVVSPVGPGAASSPPAKRRHLGLWIAIASVVVVAIGGWTAFGITFANIVSTSAQLSETSDRLQAAETQLERVVAERDVLQAAKSDVDNRETAVTQREFDVKAREEAVKATEDYQRATTLQDGITYTVGLTMEPGTYRANSKTDSCYWAIYTSGTNYDDIVDNGFAAGAVTITVNEGQDFTSNRCGDWTKVG